MASSGPDFVVYSYPRPFVLPTEWPKDIGFGFFFELIDRDCLYYSAKTMEEIMAEIATEFARRGWSKPEWKIYKSSSADYDTFTNPNKNGSHLNNVAVKWFPQYIADIQAEIDILLADVRVPDSRAALMARLFCNNIGVQQNSYTNVTKLKDGIYTPNGTLYPLTRAKAGLWPFTDTYVEECKTWLGITSRGAARVVRDTDGTKAAIRTTDPNWPKSVIGQASGSSSHIDGIDIPMSYSRRPDFSLFPRRESNGKTDYDEGYGYLAHVPHVVQQVRYQPPMVEWFPKNYPVRHYVSRLYSSTTPNLNWVLAQPITQQVQENWGYWLIQGYTGFSNGAVLRYYNDPSTASAELGQCPYSLFYPPPTASCSCKGSSTASLIWWAREYPLFRWDEKYYTQNELGSMKPFSKHCKLKIKWNKSGPGGGTNVDKESFIMYIITGQTGIGGGWVKLFNIDPTTLSLNEGPSSYITITSSMITVDLQDRLKAVTGWYKTTGTDSIMAIWIAWQAETLAQWQCAAVYTKRGRDLPASCMTQQICAMPDSTNTISYIHLDEEVINGDPVSDY